MRATAAGASRSNQTHHGKQPPRGEDATAQRLVDGEAASVRAGFGNGSPASLSLRGFPDGEVQGVGVSRCGGVWTSTVRACAEYLSIIAALIPVAGRGRRDADDMRRHSRQALVQ